MNSFHNKFDNFINFKNFFESILMRFDLMFQI
jgi:hypothetical protein